ncbi:MAG: helix-turn-helix transcriptional regulator [Spirochaetales bacterium]|nr:helix-turn-helix transcriptional regulator [Spirochaetales bacterium]
MVKPKDILRYAAFLFPLLFLIPIIYAVMQHPLHLFPWKQRVYRVDAYSDEGDPSRNTASSIDLFKTDVNAVTLEYTLRDGVTFPYAGFYFSTDVNDKGIDVSDFDYVKMTAAAAVRDVYQIKIKTHLEGHTVENDSNTRCPLEKAIVLENFMKEYRIPLSEFEFLDWWFDRQHLSRKDYSPNKLLRIVASVNIQQTKKITQKTEEPGGLIVGEFSFHRSFTLLYILSGTGFLLSFGILIAFRVRAGGKKAESGAQFHFDYNPVDIASHAEEDTRRLEAYIMEHYTDPDMTAGMLHRHTGIARRRIAGLIRKKHGLTVKQLVSRIRLREAARLLSETDRNITEIASALGFSSSSYFFQVFKSAYHLSPSEYRKKNRPA